MTESQGSGGASLIDTPVFVLGMMPHCGANTVARALLAHRETTASNTQEEDFLISGMAHLDAYCAGIAARRAGGDSKNERQALADALLGLLNRGRSNPACRLIAKTQSVEGLSSVRRYFPQVPIIVIVRDGPSVLSAMKHYDRGFHELAQEWKEAAQSILEAEKNIEDSGDLPLIVLRYEQLIEDPSGLAKALAEPLGLAPDGFDHAELASLDPNAASAFRGTGNVIHLTPAQSMSADQCKTPPLNANWEPAQYRRFDQLTDGLSEALGYELPYRFTKGAVSKLGQRLRSRFGRKIS